MPAHRPRRVLRRGEAADPRAPCAARPEVGSSSRGRAGARAPSTGRGGARGEQGKEGERGEQAASASRGSAEAARQTGSRTERNASRGLVSIQGVDAMICGAELDAKVHGVKLFLPRNQPRNDDVEMCLEARRRGTRHRDVLPRRLASRRRPSGSKTAFKFSRGPKEKFIQKKGQIVKIRSTRGRLLL